MDTRYKGRVTADDVPIVRKYLDMFLEDLPRVPLERQVGFRIDLVPSATLIPRHHIGWILPICRSCLHNYGSC